MEEDNPGPLPFLIREIISNTGWGYSDLTFKPSSNYDIP